MTIDPVRLTEEAFSILVSDLEARGNVLSQLHRAALLELVDTLAGYSTGQLQGRRAFGLPTGLGKTSAITAFIAAAHRLGYRIPVSVAASKVKALCGLKRDLMEHGVPEADIGLKHAVSDATEPSTGSESRLFQLVTHARVRSGRDFDLFGTHEGQPRALLIYDETLLRADAFAFSEQALRQATACLAIAAEGKADQALSALVAYLQECAETIKAGLDHLKEAGDPNGNGLPVNLPYQDECTVELFRQLVQRHSRVLRGFDSELDTLLTLSQETLQVLTTEQGQGVVCAREAVPATLRNVVVLDASGPIRELARLDPTVQHIDSFDSAQLKSFEDVQVFQILSPGGRSSIEGSFTAARQEASAVSKEVADIIRDRWDEPGGFLVFNFVKRGTLDLTKELDRDLRRSGIDLEARTEEGKPRVKFLTWGQHEGLNGYEYCQTVIMAGVLHRSHLDLSALTKGQTGNLREPTPSSRIRELVESEIAHAVYQGASRGSCRRVKEGRAMPMSLYFIHRNSGIRSLLDRVMPGAQWSYPDPKHLKKATAEGKAAQLLGQLLVYLKSIPEDVLKVSSREVKAAMGLDQTKAVELAFTRCRELLDPSEHGWAAEGRSFVRSGVAYGFIGEYRT
ncbi:hypothetical protein [Eleftheria terrae]|uniref:hypothetical protein n=1 Tax=Eleftheria terrae TaxID=1597781 RepID=UPI00263B13AD|nr:hypothetical protein [Eleftheria terrae]WKB55968.1 hypothetical protein N7L95_28260 [Eleftheria terrae]